MAHVPYAPTCVPPDTFAPCGFPCLPHPAGMSSTFGDSGTFFRFYWFCFAFVTFTLFCIFLATFSRWGLHFARAVVSNLVAICVVLMMIAAEAFTGYEMVYDLLDLGNYTWWHARFRSACAGAIMTVVWLILLLMAVGTK